MRKYEKFSKEELRIARAEIEGTVKAYHIAIYKNKDYINEIERLRMIATYNMYKTTLKDIMWEMEGRELNIIA